MSGGSSATTRAFISDSYNSGTVTGRNQYNGGGTNIGGVAGENEDTNEVNTEVVSFNTDLINGPVFNPNSGTIETSYNTGTVDGVTHVGGIAGVNDNGATITTCYNVGAIGDTDATYVGGIAGDNQGVVGIHLRQRARQRSDGNDGGAHRLRRGRRAGQ